MTKIVLIGAGQLSSRHLQALARIKMPISLEVVRPDNSAVVVAMNHFLEMPANNINIRLL